MVYFNFPKTASFSWKLENSKTYCLQQLVQVQEYINFQHNLLTDLPCGLVVKIECSRQINSAATDNRTEGSSLAHPTLFLRFWKTFLRISTDAIYISNRLDSQSDYSYLYI